MAKTVLLSKIAVRTSMHHVRPVTIPSSLYRLYSKVILQVTANVWKQFFPIQISGGLPGRGVKEIAYPQKRKIEDALSQKQTCGGLTMDLIKAFNTFGRFAVVVVDSWIRSLSLMIRFPTLDQHVQYSRCPGGLLNQRFGNACDITLFLLQACHTKDPTIYVCRQLELACDRTESAFCGIQRNAVGIGR